MIQLVTVISLFLFGFLFWFWPIYMIAYLVTATIFFMGIDVITEGIKKDFDYYCAFLLVWLYAPILFWSSL